MDRRNHYFVFEVKQRKEMKNIRILYGSQKVGQLI